MLRKAKQPKKSQNCAEKKKIKLKNPRIVNENELN